MMEFGGLLRYTFLLAIAKSLNAVATSVTTIRSFIGTAETAVPDEIIHVPGKEGRNVIVHAYLNEAAKRAKVKGRPCVTYITLHGTTPFDPGILLILTSRIGGGFILKGQGRDAGFIKHLLQSAVLDPIPLIILDSDYPHAPEYPFPAAIEDISSLVAYVRSRPDLYDPTKLLLGGFSAGANIALGVSTFLGEKAINAGEPHPIQGIVAFYPPVNLTGNRGRTGLNVQPSHPIPGAVIPKQMSDFFDACYFNSSPDPDGDKRKPHASPALADVATFPSKVLLITCEYDHLQASSEQFRAKLKTEGDGRIDVRGRCIEGVGHGWDGMITKEGVPGWKERVEAYDEAVKLVRDVAAN